MREIVNKQESSGQSIRKFNIAEPTWTHYNKPLRLAFIVFFGICHALWIFEFDIIVFAMVPSGWLEHCVDGFMGKIKKERFVPVLIVLEPIESVIGE